MTDRDDPWAPRPGAELTAKMCAVMRDVGGVAHDKRNQAQGYDYASAAAVCAAIQRAMATHGLVIEAQRVEILATEQTTSQRGTVGVRLTTRTTIRVGDGSGACAIASALASGADSGDKAPMKADTVGAKYALARLFVVSLGVDPEADEETDRDPPQRAAAPAPASASAPRRPREQPPQRAAAEPKARAVDGRGARVYDAGFRLRFGRAKGTAVRDAQTEDLEWYAAKLDPASAQWGADNRAIIAVIEAELARRKDPGMPAEEAGDPGPGDDDIPF